ncbi:MAG: zf-HC2 domain-containing protein, partial [Planctomycetota bacterium]
MAARHRRPALRRDRAPGRDQRRHGPLAPAPCPQAVPPALGAPARARTRGRRTVNCRTALRLLPLHAGGDLSAARVADLELHLAGCPTCAAELAVWMRLRGVLAAAAPGPGEAAAGLWGALEPRLDAVDASRRLRRPWYRRPWP